METASIVASVVSVILAFVAIGLAVFFYRMSHDVTQSTREAAKDIQSGVSRLEKLFDSLYTDTFGMMKETFTDMRKHMWPDTGADETSNLVEQKANEKIAVVKEEVSAELSNIFSKIGTTDQKVKAVESRLESLVDRAITQSRRVEKEARDETIRDVVLDKLRKLGKPGGSIRWVEFIESIPKRISSYSAAEELIRLQEDGLVLIPGHPTKPLDIEFGHSDHFLLTPSFK